MSCNQCTKINPVPSCTDTDEFLLTGITFPDNVNADITVRLKDLATGRIEYIFITTDGTGATTGIDIAPFMPLMQHYYSIEFQEGGSPAVGLLTNPDATTESNCCFEFFVYEGLIASDEWALTGEDCAAV